MTASATLGPLLTYFRLGGAVMLPLALATLVLWFAIGYRLSALRAGPLSSSVRALVDKRLGGKLVAPRGIVEEAVVIGVEVTRERRHDLRHWLDDAFADFDREARRFATLVGAIVGVAPLLGLLGTVIGMIEAFDSLGDMALYTQSGGIAGGIAQALFTTQFGLAIAIPGLIVKGWLDRRQQSIELELAQLKDVLCTLAGEGRVAAGGARP